MDACTSSSVASSEIKTLMVTVSSMVPMADVTSAEPTMKRPMIKSDRKMVMTAPNDVVQLRKKWLKASRSE